MEQFLPPARFGAVKEITPMRPGMSGAAVYGASTERGEFVLRVHHGDRAAWERGVAMHRLAAEHGIAPAVAHVDEAGMATVAVRVPGPPFSSALADPDTRAPALASLGAQLARLRAVPIDRVPPNPPPTEVLKLWRTQVARPEFPAWARGLGERLEAAAHALTADPQRAMIHGDLNPSNILWDGETAWIVDWQGAGLSHPAVDLASMATFTRLPPDRALAMLGAADAVTPKAFAAALELSGLTYGAAFLMLVPDLAGMPIADFDQAPTLTGFYERVRAGQIEVATPLGQALFGAALLKERVLAG